MVYSTLNGNLLCLLHLALWMVAQEDQDHQVDQVYQVLHLLLEDHGDPRKKDR